MNIYTEVNIPHKKNYVLTSKYVYDIIKKSKQFKKKSKLILILDYDDKNSVRLECNLNVVKKDTV